MKVVALALAVVALAVAVWGVAEFHYRNCVNAAKASPPMTDSFGGGTEIDTDALERDVRGCSRLPF